MPRQLEPGQHVLADRHGRERVRLLEHHADAHADLLGPRAGGVDVLAVEQDLAVERGAGDELVHAVEQAQERGLAAARRSDQRGDLAGRHDQVDALEHEVIAEPGARVARLERGRAGRRSADRARPCGRVPARRGAGEGGGGDGGVATLGHGRSPAGEGARRQDVGARAATAALRAVTADEAGDGEQREHDEHQHQGAGEATGDRGRRPACGCCGSTNSGRLSCGPENGLAFMRS